MKHWLSEFIYPQCVFGKELVSYIDQNLSETKLIIDCPCGNGETTHHLSKATGASVLGIDLSSESIKTAKNNYKGTNISFMCADIKESVAFIKSNSTYCLINSLFLFDNASEILILLQQKLKEVSNSKLIIIVPNTKGKNFVWFQKKHPNENKFILEYEEFQAFFEKMNFKVNQIKPICYTHHFNRTDTRFLSLFWGIYLNFLNSLQTILKIGKPNYFFIALST
ncbi:MAG: class I SAM-dependent methyltransferase [Bacteroidota bacterium]